MGAEYSSSNQGEQREVGSRRVPSINLREWPPHWIMKS